MSVVCCSLLPTPSFPPKSWWTSLMMKQVLQSTRIPWAVQIWTAYSRAFQPVAHGPHAAHEAILCGPQVICILKVWAELMKKWNKALYNNFRPSKSGVVANMMSLIFKILRKMYKNPLIFLHAARLKTWLTGVRPTVHKLESPGIQYVAISGLSDIAKIHIAFQSGWPFPSSTQHLILFKDNLVLHTCWQILTTLKQVNFVGNLISRKVQIRKIKLPWNCKFYIDNNGKFSIFTTLSCHWIGNNFQLAKKKKKKNLLRT